MVYVVGIPRQRPALCVWSHLYFENRPCHGETNLTTPWTFLSMCIDKSDSLLTVQTIIDACPVSQQVKVDDSLAINPDAKQSFSMAKPEL